MALLGSVGQIILGAGLLSAVFAYLLREYEHARQRRGELRGLLRLIAGEIARNVRTLDAYAKNPRAMAQSLETLLQTRNWDENRVRLAQLVKNGERFDAIFTYYHATAVMEDSQLWRNMSAEDTPTDSISDHVALNLSAAERAYGAIERELEQAGFSSNEVRKLEKDLPKSLRQ